MTSFMRSHLLKQLLKVSQKMLQKKKMLLGYELVTLNIDIIVYIAVLRTVTDGKERKLLLSFCQQLSGQTSGRISGSDPARSSTIRLQPDSKIDYLVHHSLMYAICCLW